jgi:hypothetical protein
MSRILLLATTILLLALPGSAQTTGREAALAAQTEKLLEAMYAQAGPDLVCLLYEPGVALVLAGLRPQAFLTDVLKTGDETRLAELNVMLEPQGLRLQKGHNSVKVESLAGLEQVVQASGLFPTDKFQAAQGWDAWSAWLESAEKSLEARYPGKASSLMYAVEQGEPDSAVLAVLARGELDRSLSSGIPYARVLAGEQADFTVQPKDAGNPDVRAALATRTAFLKALYTAPAVQARLVDPRFLAAREARRKKTWSSDREAWLRDEKLDYSLRPDASCPIASEQLLIDHEKELLAMAESGASPQQMKDALEDWLAQRGLAGRLASGCLEDWIWAGGYSTAPSRVRFYQTMKTAKPALFEQLAATFVERWKTEAEKPTKVHAQVTLTVFKHPDVQAYYIKLPPAEQAAIRELLDEQSFDIDVRALLAAPPFDHMGPSKEE